MGKSTTDSVVSNRLQRPDFELGFDLAINGMREESRVAEPIQSL